MTEEMWVEATTTGLRAVLQAAAGGVVTVLTDSGQPLARVLPGHGEGDRQSLRAALQELEEIRARTTRGPESASDLTGMARAATDELSACDAAYRSTAIRDRSSLATTDRRLAAAAVHGLPFAPHP